MALHGEVKVNHRVILTWWAQNTGERDDDGATLYRCGAFTPAGHKAEWWLHHQRSEGAAALAAGVLAVAYTQGVVTQPLTNGHHPDTPGG